MTLPVRLVTQGRDQHVTKRARGLSFTKTAPGGHHSARVRLNVSRRDWSDLGPADRLFVYDPRDGATVWEGYTTNPTPTQGSAGEGYDVAALGGMTLASDDRRALIYIDREESGWTRNPTPLIPQSARTEFSTHPVTGVRGMMLGFPPSQPVATGSLAEMGYQSIRDGGMEIGGFHSIYASGTIDVGYRGNTAWSAPLGGQAELTMRTDDTFITLYAGDGLFPTGMTSIAYNISRIGAATNVADDNHWTHHREVVVLGRRMTKAGVHVATVIGGPGGMMRYTYVLPHEVVADVVGRMLGLVAGATAMIDATGVAQIDQLAYRQPVTASTIFDDVMSHETAFIWEILESNAAGHRFAWRRWPTDVRYEVPLSDWSARGGDVTLANRLTVSWTEDQTPRSLTVSAAVPRLDNQGRIVHAEPVTLPPGRGSQANAERIGGELLAARADPPLAGTALVDRPIIDRVTDRLVDPWRIEPGYLVRIRETGDVLRLTEMTYDDDDAAAILTLGEPSLTDDQRIARLAASA